MIISRYLKKEILASFFSITGVLVLIAASQRFIAYLGKSAKGELPVMLVFKAVGFYIPELLAYLMPLGFFMAILFAYGRLYADSEMIIFASSGLSLKKLIRITLKLGVGVALGVGLLTVLIVPGITKQREKVLAKGESIGMLHLISPGRFHTLDASGVVFYVGEKEKEVLKNIFIAQKAHQKTQNTLITAKIAKLTHGEKNKAYLVLQEGFRFSVAPSELEYTKVAFEEYGREIIQPQARFQEKPDTASTRKLFRSENQAYKAELQWRFATPFSILVLSLLAIPLAKVDPRQGRFARFLPGILLYILYYNLLLVSKRAVITETLPSWCGLWCVHGIFFLVSVFLFSGLSSKFKLSFRNRR